MPLTSISRNQPRLATIYQSLLMSCSHATTFALLGWCGRRWSSRGGCHGRRSRGDSWGGTILFVCFSWWNAVGTSDCLPSLQSKKFKQELVETFPVTISASMLFLWGSWSWDCRGTGSGGMSFLMECESYRGKGRGNNPCLSLFLSWNIGMRSQILLIQKIKRHLTTREQTAGNCNRRNRCRWRATRQALRCLWCFCSWTTFHLSYPCAWQQPSFLLAKILRWQYH